MVSIKLTALAIAAGIFATAVHADEQAYPRHSTYSDYFPLGVVCKMDVTDIESLCESNTESVRVFENDLTRSHNQGFPKCTILTEYKTNAPCIVDPSPNEPSCNHEARMAVAKHHGFGDMAHANMSEAIQGSERLQREFDKVYNTCMAKHNYCVLRG